MKVFSFLYKHFWRINRNTSLGKLKTGLPQTLVNAPSDIFLYILLDEKIHLPFHVESIPSKTYNITIRRVKGSSVIEEHPADLYYLHHLDELLESVGVMVENGKWARQINCLCSTLYSPIVLMMIAMWTSLFLLTK